MSSYRIRQHAQDLLREISEYDSLPSPDDEVYRTLTAIKPELLRLVNIISDPSEILVKNMKIRPRPKKAFIEKGYETLNDIVAAGRKKLLSINGVGIRCLASIEREYRIELK